MTRVRTDHEFVQHPRWETLGGDAFLLHHAALAHVNATGSDGLISRRRARTLHPGVRNMSKQIKALLDDGLWTEDGPEHYRVCDVVDDLRAAVLRGDEQPSAAAVVREKEGARLRKERWSERRQNGVPERGRNVEKNAVRNTPLSCPVLSSPVQDPKGSGPALAAPCDHGAARPALCALCRAQASGVRTGS